MLKVNFLKKEFKNPLVLASGILGVTGASMAKVVRDGAAGVTMKSVTSEPISGNPNPVMVGVENYMINAVGLPGPGVENSIPELVKFKELCDGVMIGSIFGRTVDEFGEVAEMIGDAPIDFLEVNISCPNAKKLYKTPFAADVKLAEEITKKVKSKIKIPIAVKLSPMLWSVGDFAKAVEAAGADALTCVNTANGMHINIQARRPVLAAKGGGVSGPSLKPIAMRAVWDAYNSVKIPIIGTGGITTGTDAVEMIMAGARLIGVGSAFYYRGDKTMEKIGKEMEAIMKEEGFADVEQIIGLAHKE